MLPAIQFPALFGFLAFERWRDDISKGDHARAFANLTGILVLLLVGILLGSVEGNLSERAYLEKRKAQHDALEAAASQARTDLNVFRY